MATLKITLVTLCLLFVAVLSPCLAMSHLLPDGISCNATSTSAMEGEAQWHAHRRAVGLQRTCAVTARLLPWLAWGTSH